MITTISLTPREADAVQRAELYGLMVSKFLAANTPAGPDYDLGLALLTDLAARTAGHFGREALGEHCARHTLTTWNGDESCPVCEENA